MSVCAFAALAAAILCATIPGKAAAAPPGKVEWQAWQEQRYLGPIAVPEGGLFWEVDTARFTLRSGQLWLLESTSLGVHTGVAFEGDGRFEMVVPDAIERRQLKRFARDREITQIDESFGRLVLRSSDQNVVERLGELAGAAGQTPRWTRPGFARHRHERWLIEQQHDANARVIAGLRNLATGISEQTSTRANSGG